MSDDQRFADLEKRIAGLEMDRARTLGLLHGAVTVARYAFQREWFGAGAVYQAHADRLFANFEEQLVRREISDPSLNGASLAIARQASREAAREIANGMINQFDAYDGPPPAGSS